MTVYVVAYGNYEPVEVSSVWSTQELANEAADRLNREADFAAWHVVEWHVGTERPETW